MPKITIDKIEYNTEDLSEAGVAQVASLQFLEVQKTLVVTPCFQMWRNGLSRELHGVDSDFR